MSVDFSEIYGNDLLKGLLSESISDNKLPHQHSNNKIDYLYKAFYQVFALISSKGSQSPLIFISVQIILQTHFFLQVYNKVFKIHHKLIKACFVLFSSKMY